ncbi:MAG: thiosulfate/3-mercaptopyruvate sulfurtransferase [Porticoccus sp.]|jgi:thiosulfate/3-mercaptopyruvate sulfurtransferase
MSEISPLLEPEALINLLSEPNILIVDLCNDSLYRRMHIPGAVHVSPQELMCGAVPWTNKLPTQEQLTALVSRIGLTDDKHVVVYDDEGGGWAGRFIWTLDVIGHTNWSYLNGGLVAWHNEGHPTTSDVPAPYAIERDIIINRSPIIEAEEIMEHLNAPSLEKGELQIWDARSLAEYTGEKVLTEKGGHIPGAIHCDWTSMMDIPNNMRIREDALPFLESLGLTPGKPTITHCQSHHRSGFTYLLGRLLGFSSIRAYDGSWAEWGNREDTPVEQ